MIPVDLHSLFNPETTGVSATIEMVSIQKTTPITDGASIYGSPDFLTSSSSDCN
jgi:hypothetical protein